jgi:hypothetical protein
VPAGIRVGQGRDRFGDIQQHGQIDAGADPHVLEGEDQIFGRGIAGRARCKRTPAEPGNRGIKDPDTRIICIECVGNTQAERIVTVIGPGDDIARKSLDGAPA